MDHQFQCACQMHWVAHQMPIMQGSHRALRRHILKACVPAWGGALASLVDRFVKELTWESLRDLLAFPKLTLLAPVRAGKKHNKNEVRTILDRVARFMDGEVVSLWDEFRGQGIAQSRSRRPPSTSAMSIQEKVDRIHDAPFLRTLSGLMQDGAFSKAVRHLLSDGVHDAMDEGVRHKLFALHPSALPIPTTSAAIRPWNWRTMCGKGCVCCGNPS